MIDEKFDELARTLVACGSPISLAILELIQRNGRASFDAIIDELGHVIPTMIRVYLDTLIDRQVIRFEEETRSYIFNPSMPLVALRLIDALFPVESADKEEETRSALITLIDKTLNNPQRSAQLADEIFAMLLGTSEE